MRYNREPAVIVSFYLFIFFLQDNRVYVTF